jgi:peptidoglycan/xylan/chitin deacetylase (PgdA/CDA1 family)
MTLLAAPMRLALACGMIILSASANDLLNLPLPEGGLRQAAPADLEPKWPKSFGEGSVCLWGDDKFAPISITIDDNIKGDHEFWRQIAREYGWKFTWFVIVHPVMWDIHNDAPGSNTAAFGTAADFRILYEEGHEIELHGATTDMNSLDDAAYEEHLLKSKAHLENHIGHRILTFAYPSGEIGRPDAPTAFRDVVAKHFIAARGTTGGSSPPQVVDYLNTNSLGEGVGYDSSEEKSPWRRMEFHRPSFRHSSYRGWGSLLFHKVKKPEAARAVFDYLKAHEEKYWIRPYSVVARYAQQRESAKLVINKVQPNSVSFTLTDGMRNDFFNVPLTVKVNVGSWKAVSASQANHLVPARLVEHNGTSFALVDAVPDQGPVTVINQTR